MSEQALRINNFDELDSHVICYWKAEDDWLLYLPSCGVGNLRLHQVKENEDRTITVIPSIKVTGHNQGNPMIRHGYLTNGIWTEC